MRQKLILPSLFILIFLSGCKSAKLYSDSFPPFSIENITKIKIEIRTLDKFSSFEITDKQEMQIFIQDLNKSKLDGPWKGAKWDIIILVYENQEEVLNTNGKVFGNSSSGMFYKLNSKYRKYWNNLR